MRKLLLSSVAIVAMSASALAADLPRREAAVAPIFVAPIFTWSGFYVGLNAGATFNDNDHRYRADGWFRNVGNPYTNAVVIYDNEYNGFRNDDDAAFTGGAQMGFNWQFGAWVAGVEADINYRGNGDNHGFNILGTEPYSNYGLYHSGSDRGNWFGTLRARLGFALDRTLIYATGGLAFGDTGGGGRLYAYNVNYPGVALTGGEWRSDGDDTSWGWTLGAGVEHAFSNNWTAKLEYLYVNLDRDNNRLTNIALPNYTFTTSNEDKFHVVRVGINYKFGGASVASPVLARY
jgi:outer membrane immunogenic protein